MTRHHLQLLHEYVERHQEYRVNYELYGPRPHLHVNLSHLLRLIRQLGLNDVEHEFEDHT